jgi:hypothetical protein
MRGADNQAAGTTSERNAQDNKQKRAVGDLIHDEQFRDLEEYLLESGVFVDTLPPGGSKLPPMKIEFRDDFVLPPLLGNRKYGDRAMAALLAEVESQVQKGVIELCDDAPVVAVVMVKKLDSPSGYRFCIDARPTNEGYIVNPFNQITRSL